MLYITSVPTELPSFQDPSTLYTKRYVKQSPHPQSQLSNTATSAITSSAITSSAITSVTERDTTHPKSMNHVTTAMPSQKKLSNIQNNFNPSKKAAPARKVTVNRFHKTTVPRNSNKSNHVLKPGTLKIQVYCFIEYHHHGTRIFSSFKPQ